MKQWVGLGKFLAGHMQVIVPICVTLGVLFPQQIGVLKPIVPALFAFMTYQVRSATPSTRSLRCSAVPCT